MKRIVRALLGPVLRWACRGEACGLAVGNYGGRVGVTFYQPGGVNCFYPFTPDELRAWGKTFYSLAYEIQEGTPPQ